MREYPRYVGDPKDVLAGLLQDNLLSELEHKKIMAILATG